MKRSIFLVLLLLAVFSVGVCAQTADEIKPPSESSSRADLEKWMAQALGKYGKYRNRARSVSVSSAKFAGCTLSLDVLHKPNTIDNDSDRTVFSTKKVTQAVAIDLSRIAPGGIAIEDFLDPDLRTLVVKLADGSKTDIVVRGEAAVAIQNVLERLSAACTSKQ